MATLKTTIRTPSVVRTIVRGMGRPGESAQAAPIPANTALGNFTEATALPTAQTKSAWITWLDVPTNSDPRLSDARDWFASSVSQAEAEAGTEVVDRKWSALRVRQSTRVNHDWDPTGNLFTIGTSTNSQRLRLRRRFAGAGDFSQLSIDFSGDNCRIQTQHAGNTPNPLCLGTAGVDRLFLAADATRVGIGGAPTTRPLEIFAGTAGFRLQSSSAVSPPVYTEIARTFDFQTWQDSTSPFNTFTDLVANSNQFNNHSVRLFVHTSGTSAPVLHSVFHSSGRLLIGTDVDNGTDRVQVSGSVAITGDTSTLSVGNINVFPSGVHRLGNLYITSNNSNGVAIGSPGFTTAAVIGNNTLYAQNLGLGGNLFALPDCLFTRNATGPAIRTQSQSGLQVRNAANTADAPVTCSSLSASQFIAIANPWHLVCDQIRTNSGGTAVTFRNNSNTADVAINCGAINSSGATEILIPSATNTRETILRARVSDAGNDAFHIFNATIFDGGFAAGFSGSRFTAASSALAFIGNIDAANDTGSNAIVEFTARRTSSQTDPNNGTLTDVSTRNLFGWNNNTTRLMTMFANGNLALNSTTDNGARLQVNGGVTSNQLTIGGSGAASSPLIFFNGAGSGNEMGLYRSGFDVAFASQGVAAARISYAAGICTVRDNHFGITSEQFNGVTAAADTRWSRSAAGVWRAGTTANNALGSIELANITASGNLTVGSILGSGFSAITFSGFAINMIQRVNSSADLGGNTNESGSLFNAFATTGGTTGICYRARVNNNAGLLLSGHNSSNTQVVSINGIGVMATSGHITSAFQSLSADPSTIDIGTGLHRVVKNTTSGEVRDWVNDGGVMKKSPAYT